MNYDSIDAFLKAVEAVGEAAKDKSFINEMKKIRNDSKEYLEEAEEKLSEVKATLSECHTKKKSINASIHGAEKTVIDARKMMDDSMAKARSASKEMMLANQGKKRNDGEAYVRAEELDAREKRLQKAESKLELLEKKVQETLDMADSRLREVNATKEALRRVVA